ncbi:helix-turn-helix domain-containing protein [Mesonia maritima]|uniref:helix-turn-helix domain-containing protein n=1 Tax=Mesonia maritima TaxID=1793873 RepID=UPI0036413B69
MEKELTSPNFGPDAFGKELGMSRMQLHRKLKSLTGDSTSAFIRNQRLKLAAKLLKKSDTNIAQVGYAVGFSSPSYFSRSFKKVYGQSPKEFSGR